MAFIEVGIDVGATRGKGRDHAEWNLTLSEVT